MFLFLHFFIYAHNIKIVLLQNYPPESWLWASSSVMNYKHKRKNRNIGLVIILLLKVIMLLLLGAIHKVRTLK